MLSGDHGCPLAAAALGDRVTELESLLAEVRACRACENLLPLGPRPVLQMSTTARILVASQAPGTKVHESGIPFSDASGERLRQWMGLSPDQFYDAGNIAIVPMGLCYPGRAANGDAPPRPECARLWRDRLVAAMPRLCLTLLVGSHSQNHVLGPGSVTERVRDFASYLPTFLPLPHPSWRVTIWARKHTWFDEEVLPELRRVIRQSWPELGGLEQHRAGAVTIGR